MTDEIAAVTAWVSASRAVARWSWISTLRTATVDFCAGVPRRGGHHRRVPGSIRGVRAGAGSALGVNGHGTRPPVNSPGRRGGRAGPAGRAPGRRARVPPRTGHPRSPRSVRCAGRRPDIGSSAAHDAQIALAWATRRARDTARSVSGPKNGQSPIPWHAIGGQHGPAPLAATGRPAFPAAVVTPGGSAGGGIRFVVSGGFVTARVAVTVTVMPCSWPFRVRSQGSLPFLLPTADIPAARDAPGIRSPAPERVPGQARGVPRDIDRGRVTGMVDELTPAEILPLTGDLQPHVSALPDDPGR